jgi:hypothetical protein
MMIVISTTILPDFKFRSTQTIIDTNNYTGVFRRNSKYFRRC